MYRTLVLLGIFALGLTATWRSDGNFGLGNRHVPTTLPTTPSAISPVTPPELTDVWKNHPAAREWSAEARLKIVRWEPVESLDGDIALFETVFWEPRDTTSLRARLDDASPLVGKTVLEIGTGSGLLALCCLNAGAEKVVATDVNPTALCNALYNAKHLRLADRLELRRVRLDRPDAFSVIGDAERFDLIVSNPPWEDGVPESIDRYAYYDPGFHLLRSLLAGLDDHLEPGGKAMLAYGSREAIRTVLRLAPRYSLKVEVLDTRDLDRLPGVFLPGMLLEVSPR